MIRPPKNILEADHGALFARGGSGYRWYFFKKGDLTKEKTSRRVAWAEDGGRYYFTCPFCFGINQAETDGTCARLGRSPDYKFTHNGRDLDSYVCEVCSKCAQHMWVTFTDAVPRKIWGAIKLDKKKCPKCRRPVQGYSRVDIGFATQGMTSATLFDCCGMRWK